MRDLKVSTATEYRPVRGRRLLRRRITMAIERAACTKTPDDQILLRRIASPARSHQFTYQRATLGLDLSEGIGADPMPRIGFGWRK
jgi:hypothetical protein